MVDMVHQVVLNNCVLQMGFGALLIFAITLILIFLLKIAILLLIALSIYSIYMRKCKLIYLKYGSAFCELKQFTLHFCFVIVVLKGYNTLA